MKKNIIVLIATGIFAVVLIVIGLVRGSPASTATSDLPVVYENLLPDKSVAGGTEDFTNISLPEVDNPGIPVTEAELPTPEEIAEIKEIESVQEVADVVKPPEQIVADNDTIKKAVEEAAANPDVVQPVQIQPVEIEPAPEEPAKNADGFIYTKEQAVQLFVSNADAMAQIKDPDLLAHAKTKASFSQEAFDADLNQLLTDPYSSPLLTPCLENFRKTGDMSLLIVFSASWLGIGGDDGEWAERETR